MILAIRTDKPEAELGLYEGKNQIDYEVWPAHRQLAETLNAKIDELLRRNDLKQENVSGIVVFEGPGSFTGLRIGMSVANALAYSLDVPIVASNQPDWQLTNPNSSAKTTDMFYAKPNYGDLKVA